MGKRILREPEILNRVGVGKTKFRKDYVETGRVRWIPLGPRTKGLLEDEVDALVEEIAQNRTPLEQPQVLKGANKGPRRRKKVA
jgi:hypothetical protein